MLKKKEEIFNLIFKGFLKCSQYYVTTVYRKKFRKHFKILNTNKTFK